VLSGSVIVGGAIALVEPAINTVAYHFHEKAWARAQRPRSTRMYVSAQEQTIQGLEWQAVKPNPTRLQY
jgi:uncharacterized membrane protein